ncbi:helix-turn-helix domain-containing protein [Pimelobacter simplex]|uniref:helix-turn-helix domain-containing protein n=1 Tax=Nocardioides simplex TaxID=2045 RepID=UPI003AB054A0
MTKSGLLTVKEAAVKLRRSTRFVTEELRQKRLRGSKYGGSWSIDPDDLDSYVQAHANMSRVRRTS